MIRRLLWLPALIVAMWAVIEVVAFFARVQGWPRAIAAVVFYVFMVRCIGRALRQTEVPS